MSGFVQTLWFDEPSAIVKGQRKSNKVEAEEFYNKYNASAQALVASKHKYTFHDLIDANKVYSPRELATIVKRRVDTIRTMLATGRLEGTKSNNTWCILGSAYIKWATTSSIQEIPTITRYKTMHLRCCEENTGLIKHTSVTSISATKQQEAFEIALENGYTTLATQTTVFLTDNGYKTLAEAISLQRNASGIWSWCKNKSMFACNGSPLYRDKQWMETQRQTLQTVQAIASKASCSQHTIRVWLKKHNLSYSAKERGLLAGLTLTGKSYDRKPYQISQAHLESIKKARSGEKSNFWKGGISSERDKISQWTRQIASMVHAKYNFMCVICSSRKRLHAHHVDPVWHSLNRARDENNLVTLCQKCHSTIHSQHLELKFLAEFQHNKQLTNFLTNNCTKQPVPEQLKREGLKLIRTYVKVKHVRHVGLRILYDISTEQSTNYVQNGFIILPTSSV